MYKQIQDIKTINFPVYRLKSDDWYYSDGILFIDGKVVDEKNMPGKTLGIRRIQCGRSDLYPLKKAYMNFESMLSSKHKIFIDTSGVPFIYNKTINCKLKYHRIKKVETKDSATIVYFKDINNPFIINRPPLIEPIWARVLYYKDVPWIIFDFQRHKGKDSIRRV